MRIFISILLFLTGVAFTAYGYVAREVARASEADLDGILNGDIPILGFVLRILFEGDIPHFSGMLYVGIFIIVIAIINVTGLFGAKSENDRRHPL